MTFEGDNNVLLQLVAKRLLGDYAKQFKGADAAALARFAVAQGAAKAYHGAGLRILGQRVRDFGSTARSVAELRDAETQRQLLTDRVETMVAELAARLRPASKLSKKAAADLFNSQQNELIEAARAHAELLQWEAFTRALDRVTDDGTRQVLTWLRDIFGLGLLEKHLAWYLINGRMSPQRAQAVTSYLDRLIARVRPHAQDLVDAFGYGPGAPARVYRHGRRGSSARTRRASTTASSASPAPPRSRRSRCSRRRAERSKKSSRTRSGGRPVSRELAIDE